MRASELIAKLGITEGYRIVDAGRTPGGIYDARRLGYATFGKHPSGLPNVNLIGHRGAYKGLPCDVTFGWGCCISAFVECEDRWVEVFGPGTTLPGIKALAEPMNQKGCAVLRPGQYRGAWERGLHKGRPALVQVRPVTVDRDTDRDKDVDPTVEDVGLFGINIHDGRNREWSSGCQVASSDTINNILELVRLGEPVFGKRVTYTLLAPGQYGQGDM